MLAGTVQRPSYVQDNRVNHTFDFGKRLRWPLLALMICIFTSMQQTASAHKMFVFAAVQGDRIEGEVYYQGGDPAPDAKITVTGPDGTTLAQAVADQEGRFRFEPRWKMDYRIVADAGFGHRAEYTVPADELPSDLPAFGADPSGIEPAPEGPEAAEVRSADPSPPAVSPPSDAAAEIAALSQQISALRRDLDRWQARLRMQDVLGGIGYILGLMGLGSYLLRNKRPTSGPSSSAPS
ncbi:MAG: carboxypeptidase regulatory-like domain-containing protein [Planctomycetaceae bacterium]|nr:MAG: carboxypeptidase regulatory-like domain-containing protein [Planctomycetaceae bacterium]